jgi:hypothetical protein
LGRGLEHDERQRWAVTALHALIKALDSSRVVLGNDGWEYTTGDVVGIHDYSQDPDHLIQRFGDRKRVDSAVMHGRTGGRRISLSTAGETALQRPVVLSEFGGINHRSGPDAWTGYGGVETADEFLTRLRAIVGAARSEGLAGYCYTQLTDTLQEQNGLLTEDRQPKMALSALAEVFGPQLRASD